MFSFSVYVIFFFVFPYRRTFLTSKIWNETEIKRRTFHAIIINDRRKFNLNKKNLKNNFTAANIQNPSFFSNIFFIIPLSFLHKEHRCSDCHWNLFKNSIQVAWKDCNFEYSKQEPLNCTSFFRHRSVSCLECTSGPGVQAVCSRNGNIEGFSKTYQIHSFSYNSLKISDTISFDIFFF